MFYTDFIALSGLRVSCSDLQKYSVYKKKLLRLSFVFGQKSILLQWNALSKRLRMRILVDELRINPYELTNIIIIIGFVKNNCMS